MRTYRCGATVPSVSRPRYESGMTRTDETWFRLLQWTQGQAPSERLAAHILSYAGFEDIDPSHPLGGKDGGRDASCSKAGRPWIMAVYFPRDQKTFSDIKAKVESDLAGALKHAPYGLAFITNQELRLSERADLMALGADADVILDLFHLERVAHILDEPSMAVIRKRYLDIELGPLPISVDLDIIGSVRRLVGGEEVLDWWLEDAAEKARQRRIRSSQESLRNPAGALQLSWMQPTPEPLTEDELEERIERWERRVRLTWPDAEDHLASTAWPGLQFRLRNTGEVFLNDVQVIITISGVRGLPYLHRDRFDQAKLLPPVIPAQTEPYAVDLSFYDELRIADYPVTWKNLDGAVEIILDLRHLRPHPVWESETDDIVLVLNGDTGSADVTARWTVTAQGYGKMYEGPEQTIPVKPISFLDSLEQVSEVVEAADE